MFRKTVISTVAAAVLVTSAFAASTSGAFASDFGKEVPPVSGKRSDRDVAAGLALGAAIAIIGAISSQDQNNGSRKGKGKNHRRHQVASQNDLVCFDKPVRKFSHRHGRKVIVGFKKVCE